MRLILIICCWLLAATLGTLALLVVSGQLQVRVIYGTSMNPKLHQGDLALAWRQDSYSVGDVVTYNARWGNTHDKKRSVLHRIIAQNEDGTLWLKGDNNPVKDPLPVPRSDVTGHLVHIFPGGGNALQRMRDWTWILAIVVAAIVLRPERKQEHEPEVVDDFEFDEWDYAQEWA
jgi:signal peptidase